MQIIYRDGNLLDAAERFIAHGCNNSGKMGKGVAKAIRDRYPWAFAAYENRFKEEGLRLGTTVWAIPPKGEPHTIINAITQKGYRKTYDDDGVRYLDYDAVRGCFAQINATAYFSKALNARWLGGPIDGVAMPLIGSGLAGGHWPTVAAIIEEECTEFQPVVYLNGQSIPT